MQLFGGEPLEWPKRSGLFTATVHNANITKNVLYEEPSIWKSKADTKVTQLRWQPIRTCLETVVQTLWLATHHS